MIGTIPYLVHFEFIREKIVGAITGCGARDFGAVFNVFRRWNPQQSRNMFLLLDF
jgi:hypothetical protein